MLLLLFRIENDRFALDAKQIIEIVPLVRLKKVPHTPGYVAGLFNYRGDIVPVIDLTCLISGIASKRKISTRIIIVHYPDSENISHMLGFMAESVTDTVDYDEHAMQSPVNASKKVDYLDKIIFDSESMIQLINLKNILPEPLKDSLFVN